jgi:hypothetical protein
MHSGQDFATLVSALATAGIPNTAVSISSDPSSLNPASVLIPANATSDQRATSIRLAELYSLRSRVLDELDVVSDWVARITNRLPNAGRDELRQLFDLVQAIQRAGAR